MAWIFNDNLISMWGPVLVILMMIALMINILVYLLGSFLTDDKLKAAARTGFVEVIYSAVLISMIWSLVQMANGVTKYLAGDEKGEVTAYLPVKMETPTGMTG